MEKDTRLSSYRTSELYEKGKLTKVRCLFLQVKEYCLGVDFSVRLNEVNLGRVERGNNILEGMKNSIKMRS